MRRKHNLNLETANQRQRFSIRKLTVGAASVLLGTTFLFGAGQTVQADSVNGSANGEPASAEVQTDSENEIQEKASDADKTKSAQEAAKKVEADTNKAVEDTQKSDSIQESKDQQVKIKTTTFKVDENKQAVNGDALKESKVANTVDTNKEQAEDTNKDPDEIHATANFVDHRTNKTIKSVELTANKGQTLYDALGTDVYDYILKTDYPSYVLLPSDEYKKKVNYRGYTGTNYFNDPKLAEEFDQWQKEYKEGKHPLMGYIPYEEDPDNPTNQDLFAGRTILEDGKTYDIPLQGPGRSSRMNVYVLLSSTPAQRLVNYNKYLGEGKEEQLAYHVENGQIYYILDNSGNFPAGVLESYDNHGQIPNEISTRTIDKTGLVSQTGMIKENQVTAAVVYPEETEAKRQAAEEAGKLAGKWTTLDSLIPEIPFVDENDDNSYETNTDNVVKKGDTPGQPAEQNIMYYSNREFKVIFKDITYGDGDKAIELKDYDYTDPKQMTMAANSKENPHNGATNDHYAEYKLSADPYNNRLDDLRNDGYAIVSTEVNLDQGHTYSVDKFNKDNLYNEDGTIKPKIYVVKVLRGVKGIKPVAQATRKVYYKANSKDGQTLKDPVTQEVTLKASEGTYYVDATLKDTDPNAKKLVHIKQATDINGTKVNVVDSENKAPIDTSWVIDDTKTLHDVDDQFNFEKPTGDEAPDTIGEWIHKPNLDINNQADRYTPVNGKNKTLDPVYLIYKQKRGQSGPDINFDKPKGQIGVSGPELSFDKPKGQIGVSGPELSFDKPKGQIGVSGPELSFDKPEGHIGVSGPELSFDKPEFKIPTKPDLLTPEIPEEPVVPKSDLPKLDKNETTESNKTKTATILPQAEKSKVHAVKNASSEVQATSKKKNKVIKKTADRNSNSTPHSEGWNKNHAPHDQWQANTMPKAAGMSNLSSVTESETNTLPQTGEEGNKTSVMGLIALSFASLLSVFGLDRKKKN